MISFFAVCAPFASAGKRRMSVLGVFLAGLLMASSARADLELVRPGGASDYEIVLPAEPTEVERFAAAELRAYLQQMTGAQLPITRDASGPSVLIGAALAEQHGTSLSEEQLGWDGFVIKAEGEQLVLAGRNQRGTLYAVYALLEQLGARWYAPRFAFYDGGAEYIPDRSAVTLEAMERIERPDYKYRKKYVEEGYTHTAENMAALIDWMAKTRMNVFVHPSDYRNRGTTVWDEVRGRLIPELNKRGMVLEVGGHGYQNYLPPDEYFDAHPEWFGMKDGERTRDERWGFNTTSEEALDVLTENILDYLRAHPEIDIFDLWPPDQVRWSRPGQQTTERAHSVNDDHAPMSRRDTIERLAAGGFGFQAPRGRLGAKRRSISIT